MEVTPEPTVEVTPAPTPSPTPTPTPTPTATVQPGRGSDRSEAVRALVPFASVNAGVGVIDHIGPHTTVTVDDPSAPSGSVVWTYEYDDAAATAPRLEKVCSPSLCESYGWTVAGPSTAPVVRTTYNNLGWIQTLTTYDSEGRVDLRRIFRDNYLDFSDFNFTYDSAPLFTAPVTSQVIDGENNTWLYGFDTSARYTSKTAPLGQETLYGYDDDGMSSSITDGNNNTVTIVYDDDRRVVQRINGEDESTWLVYATGGTRPSLDVVAECNHLSGGTVDATNCVTSVYNSAHQMTSQTRMIDAGELATKTWEYNGPHGQLTKTTDAENNETVFVYSPTGDLIKRTEPQSGFFEYTHNRWGQVATIAATDPIAGSTATTETNTFDDSGRVLVTTGPVVVNPVTGQNQQLRVDNTYWSIGGLYRATESDVFISGESRSTYFYFDMQGRERKSVDAKGGVILSEVDDNGYVDRVCDANGTCVRTDYNANNQATATWIEDYNGTGTDAQLSATTWDSGGRIATETNALGALVSYGYDKADRQTSATLVGIDGTTRDVRLHTTIFDERGLPVVVTQGGTAGAAPDRTTTTTFNHGGLPIEIRVGRTGGDLITQMDYDLVGDMLAETVRFDGGQVSRTNYAYDHRQVDKMTEVLSGTTSGPETEYTYDGFGRLVSMTDPVNASTSYAVDVLGRTTVITGAQLKLGPSSPWENPVSAIGYDVWGNVTDQQDPHGRVTTQEFDGLDRRTKIVHPSYTQPAPLQPGGIGGATITPFESFIYDSNGNLTTHTTRGGYTVVYTYNDLNLAETRTNERGHERSFTYDLAGNLTELETETGAFSTYAYNDLGLVETETAHVRAVTLPNGGGPVPASTSTTQYGYDDLGNLTTQTSPELVITSFGYDELGNQLTVTDASTATTEYTYNHLGLVVDTTDPEGRTWRNVYDPLGRLLQAQQLDGTVVARQSTYLYAADGNVLRVTDLGGSRADYWYDTHGRVRVTRVWNNTIWSDASVTRYYYNFNGVLTYQKDPELRVTTHTVNVWDLVETTTEPSTQGQTLLADREFVNVYDADGRIAGAREPGGLSIEYDYNEAGFVIKEEGDDYGGQTWVREFSYNDDNTIESVSSDQGATFLVYNDLGLVVESHNPNAIARFVYDLDGRLTSRTEIVDGVTWVHGFAWTNQNELDEHTDPVTATIAVYTYNDASQVERVDYSGTNAYRSLEYSDLGELWKDQLVDNSGTVQANSVYTYDNRGDLVSEWQGLQGIPAVTNTYEYDRARRLKTWNAIPFGGGATNTTTYTYDKSGNRLTKTAGGVTETTLYDQRNRIITSAGTTHHWNPNGTLNKITNTSNGAVLNTYSWDPFGRLIQTQTGTDPVVAYRYDSFDRLYLRKTIIDANNTNLDQDQWFAYPAASQDTIASYGYDPTITYGRSPSGQLRSLQDRNGNARIAGLNRHGDLAWLATPTSAAVTETIAYTPYGQQQDHWGTDPDPELGYQTQYTDPNTGDVLMQARWYTPATAGFRSRDTYGGDLNTPVTLNRYTYASNNPIRYWDPTGHYVCETVDCNEGPKQPYRPPPGGVAIPAEDPRFVVYTAPHTPAPAPAINFGDPADSSVTTAAGEAKQAAIDFYATGMAPGEDWYIAHFDSPLEVYVLTQDPCDNYQIATECMLLDGISSGMTDYTFENCGDFQYGIEEQTACGVSLVNIGSLVKSADGALGWVAGRFGRNATVAVPNVFGGGSGPWVDDALSTPVQGATRIQPGTGSCASACAEILTGGRVTEAQVVAQLGEWVGVSPGRVAAQLGEWVGVSPGRVAAQLGDDFVGQYFGPGGDALAAAQSGPMAAWLQPPYAHGVQPGHVVVTNPMPSGNFWVRDPADGTGYIVGPGWFDDYVVGGVFGS